MDVHQPPRSGLDRLNNWIKNSATIKILSIGFLILILLIPRAMISELVWERSNTKNSVIAEINDKWGRVQNIGGPVITIPYKSFYEDNEGELRYTIKNAHFLPEDLKIDAKLDPEIRYRGIYEAVLYNAAVSISGAFSTPDFADLNIDPSNVQWGDAHLSLGIGDMRGIRDRIILQWQDSKQEFGPGVYNNDIFNAGVNTQIPLSITDTSEKTFPFSIQLNINGSEGVFFEPMGKETNVLINSSWENPKFTGAFLPESHDINDQGFKANWKVLSLNRNFPQQWVGKTSGPRDSRFGVELIIPINEHMKSSRSIKYALMIICLTFTVFFFVEVINKIRIHPIQYLLVGFGLCLFFLLLLSLSEHIPFLWAYIIAAAGITILITTYTQAILRNLKISGMMAAMLVFVYTFLYILLQQEDYALLIGSAGLFIVLAVIMYLSRKVKWYADPQNISPKS